VALKHVSTPEAMAEAFLTTYLMQGDSVGHLEGARALYPYLSSRLRRVLDEAEDGRYAIDDFLFLRDVPRSPPLLLSESFSGCRGSRWIGWP
jgi:hypothetical protein